MRALIIVALTVVSLAGCAAQVISSTPRNVVVQARTQEVGNATALAEAECKKQGLHARLTSKPMPNQFVFDCVN